jgi:arginyl-tRNA synthetase
MFSSLSSRAKEVVKNAFAHDVSEVTFIIPRDISHGDATTTVALQLAKALGKKPQEIAEVLVKELSASPEVIKAEIAGAGYVNIWLTPKALIAELAASHEACTPKVKRKEAPVILEYSQPNIAKPLAIHHIIGTVLGQAMVNLYKHAGYNVISWNYIGDWGTQFGKLAVAFQKWGNGKKAKDCTLDELLELYVKFHQEEENDPTLEEQGREAFRKMEAGDADLRAFWQEVVLVTKSSLMSIYDRLQVSFDLDLGESFYEDKMQAIIDEGKQKGVFVEGEGGSLIVKFPEESNLPPYLIVKGDGATLYSTRDLAQMRYRMDTYNPQSIFIFTDIAQKLHFEQLVFTCRLLGWELPHFENVLFGRMSFADKAMSTRKGTVMKLEHVVDEAVERARVVIESHRDTIQTDDAQELAEMMGVGSLVYAILSQTRTQNMIFDWEKMLSFEGNSAPYLQYTHARAQSVLRKSGINVEAEASMNVETVTESERGVLRILMQLPEVLEDARVTAMPHKLANFLYELCQAFNLFYHKDPILKAEGDTREFRLSLTALTATVLKTGASLLTLRLPDQM